MQACLFFSNRLWYTRARLSRDFRHEAECLPVLHQRLRAPWPFRSRAPGSPSVFRAERSSSSTRAACSPWLKSSTSSPAGPARRLSSTKAEAVSRGLSSPGPLDEQVAQRIHRHRVGRVALAGKRAEDNARALPVRPLEGCRRAVLEARDDARRSVRPPRNARRRSSRRRRGRPTSTDDLLRPAAPRSRARPEDGPSRTPAARATHGRVRPASPGAPRRTAARRPDVLLQGRRHARGHQNRARHDHQRVAAQALRGQFARAREIHRDVPLEEHPVVTRHGPVDRPAVTVRLLASEQRHERVEDDGDLGWRRARREDEVGVGGDRARGRRRPAGCDRSATRRD